MRPVAIILFLVLISACSAPQFQPGSDMRVDPEFSSNRFIMTDGYQLPFRQYLPSGQPDSIVIALHGFNDYSNAFSGMCAYLVKRDVACIAYDQRGFGETQWRGLWPGEGVLQQDLKQILSLVRQRYPGTQIYFAGESMGGAVILSALQNDHAFWQRNLNGTVLFAPAVWARSTQPWYQRLALWIAVHTFPDWKPTGASLEIVATDNIEALREMSRDQNVIKETRIDAVYGLTNLMDDALGSADKQALAPLILYGEKDEVIPKKPTCEMLDRMEKAGNKLNVRLYPNGYHMLTRDLQSHAVFDDVIRWINRDVIEQDDIAFEQFCNKA